MGIRININFVEKRWLEIDFRAMARKAFEAGIEPFLSTDFIKNMEISILACNDQFIRRLNNKFRGINSTTDVLSWPRMHQLYFQSNLILSDDKYANNVCELGDIAISYDTCLKQSEDLGLKLENHVIHLLIHASLHLMGFNHQKDSDFQRMKDLEIKCLEACGIENPYSL